MKIVREPFTIADIIDTSYGTIQAVLMSDLNIQLIAAKFLPKLRTSTENALC